MDKKTVKTISGKSTLADILQKPGADDILAKHGVPCLSCPMASFEMEKLQIGQVCKMYRLNEKKIIEDLKSL